MNTTGLEFSVIIPVFNRWDMTAPCLVSLRKHTPGANFEVIVVDNSSTDETAAELGPLGHSLFGNYFRRIRFEENRNFAGACNAGAEAAASPLLFFLNNDTILTEGWLPPLLKAMEEEPNMGAVGPLLLFKDDLVQHGGVTYGMGGFSHLYQYFPKQHRVFYKKRPMQAITAAALMMRAPLFRACGGFYEGYKNGFEDVELCVRIRQAGSKMSVVPESRIYHLESQSSGRLDREKENARLLKERCGSQFYIDMHQHALRDGFDVGLTPTGSMFLKLKQDQEEELDAWSQGRTPEEILEKLNDCPPWQKGHDILCGHMMEIGNTTGALHLAHRGAMISNNETSALRLLGIAEKAAEYTIVAGMRDYLESAQRMRTDKSLAVIRFTELLRTAGKLGDSYLYGLYKKRLDEIKAGQ